MGGDAAQSSSRIVATEGGRKVVISPRIERDPSLRDEAIKIHGTRCCVCSLSFEAIYGEWESGFIIVHRLKPLGDGQGEIRDTDAAVDLAVVCANCHAMIHRRRDVVLTVHLHELLVVVGFVERKHVEADAVTAGVGKKLTTAEINAAWTQAGRSGKADATLTKMVKGGKLKRRKIRGGRGSRYGVA